MVREIVTKCDGPDCFRQWSGGEVALLHISGNMLPATRLIDNSSFSGDFCSWRCLGRWLVLHNKSCADELNQGIQLQLKLLME